MPNIISSSIFLTFSYHFSIFILCFILYIFFGFPTRPQPESAPSCYCLQPSTHIDPKIIINQNHQPLPQQIYSNLQAPRTHHFHQLVTAPSNFRSVTVSAFNQHLPSQAWPEPATYQSPTQPTTIQNHVQPHCPKPKPDPFIPLYLTEALSFSFCLLFITIVSL